MVETAYVWWRRNSDEQNLIAELHRTNAVLNKSTKKNLLEQKLNPSDLGKCPNDGVRAAKCVVSFAKTMIDRSRNVETSRLTKIHEFARKTSQRTQGTRNATINLNELLAKKGRFLAQKRQTWGFFLRFLWGQKLQDLHHFKKPELLRTCFLKASENVYHSQSAPWPRVKPPVWQA